MPGETMASSARIAATAPGASSHPSGDSTSRTDGESDDATEMFHKFKLHTFPSNFSPEEILIHRDDFPDIVPGDVVEIFQEGESVPRLLLQIPQKSIFFLGSQHQNKNLSRETVYIEKSIAEAFQLPTFSYVVVRKVDKEAVTLDSLELTFREQYMSRSEMWRIKSQLIDTCVFIGKKVDFCNGSIRCQVNEIWGDGQTLACGVVNEDTRVVFRSPTAMIYLFIQMSSEMWELDASGNLYFEKAVGGFLTDMFERWKRSGASHEMTIVLFSRCFYDAKDKNQFPKEMRECLQLGFNGCFYEDFYRVVVQNERFDDWSSTILELKKLFSDYKQYILEYHKKTLEEYARAQNMEPPKARISSAEQGNFLEVLNMSLNTFENQYLNRNMDRTGQQSIVLTPGVGVFEVDRDVSQVTKQRIIDSGVGSDLICVGEQPLHAVPLFVFKRTANSKGEVKHEYSMPHWINLSFYTSQTKFGSSIFRPRIKLPCYNFVGDAPMIKSSHSMITARGQDNFEEYLDQLEEFDESLCTDPLPEFQSLHTLLSQDGAENSLLRNDKRSLTTAGIGPRSSDTNDDDGSSSDGTDSSEGFSYSLRQATPSLDQSQIIRRGSRKPTLTSGVSVVGGPSQSGRVIQKLESGVVGNVDFDHHAIKRLLLFPGRALVNPFDPSTTTVKLTSNRRRWTHIFPKVKAEGHRIHGAHPNPMQETKDPMVHEWSSGVSTGVDWKSLTIPASLPITTDYFPSEKLLLKDYFFNEYSFGPDDVYSRISPLAPAPFTLEQLYRELISQRLIQGFQLIVKPKDENNRPKKSVIDYRKCALENNEVWLSIGRIYHKISISWSQRQVNLTVLRPRDPILNVGFDYRYRFQAPDNDTYEMSWVRFSPDKLESYNWNHMDLYVQKKGDRFFSPQDRIKYWRLRAQLVPLTPFLSATKDIMDPKTEYCDIYYDYNKDIDSPEGFHRFLDSCINKIKRKSSPKSKPSSENAKNQDQTRRDPKNLEDICKQMKSNFDGLAFVVQATGMCSDTFLTYDSVSWLIERGYCASSDEGIKIMKKMLEKKLIIHASGDDQHPFKYGYCFFTLTKPGQTYPYGGDFASFNYDWVEVQYNHDTGRKKTSPNTFGTVYREIEPKSAGDRPEWIHVCYERKKNMNSAFEISFNWTVATGALVADMAHSCARKANQCQFSLMPIPRDPFGLPITLDSDPVRGPIFVQMNTDFLSQDTFGKDEEMIMFIFREHIAKRFGFISCTSTNTIDIQQKVNPKFSTDNQYVHCTANMFLLIPTKLQLQTGIQGIKGKMSSANLSQTMTEEDTEDHFIMKHLGEEVPVYDHSKTGFLWSWNFMISRRWKTISSTGATGDIEFMDKMLRDFRNFCSNKDDRLKKFWNEFTAANIVLPH